MKIKSKHTLKRIVSLLLAVTILNMLTISVSAAGTYVGVDDDDAQGNSNSSLGSWSRVYSSNLKYGEGLITTCTTYGNNGASKFYKWIFAYPVYGQGDMGITLSVWLYHSQFNDPSAKYYVWTHSSMGQLVGSVNQNTAPAGWTDFPYKTIKCYDAGGVNVCQGIELIPSTRGSSYTCGADWVEATIYP